MTARLDIRTRLAMLVATMFAVVAGIAAFATLRLVEHRLVASTRATAEDVMENYLRDITNGGQIVATVDPTEPAAFFYLDRDGNEIGQRSYLEAVFATIPDDDAVTVDGCVPNGQPTPADQTPTECPPDGTGPQPSQIDDGQVLATTVDVSTVGEMHTVDRGLDTVSVAQLLRFGDGTELQIGVSSPLEPVDDSLNAIRSILWYGVPALTIAVGLLAYLILGRALRPVHSIIQRTRCISDANLSDRVPVPNRRDEIAELATTMNDMLGRLDDAQRRQQRFVADASHELRSPIAASATQLEVALAHPEHADWTTTAATVLNEQKHLGDLVDDLLTLSRLEEQGPGPTTHVDLSALVADELERPHRSDVTAVSSGPVVVDGNRPHLARAIRNLVQNADRHARRQVTVETTTHDGRALVHVDDDGPGIPPDQRLRIFERFARLDEPRHRTDGGAGLGLAIVERVARLHDGSVRCTDAPTGGARLTIELPAGRQPASQHPPSTPSSSASQPESEGTPTL